jgi:hypothetical protein
MSDFLLWLALWLCPGQDSQEMLSSLQHAMPTTQLAEEYNTYRWNPRHFNLGRECQRLLFRQAMADELAHRIEKKQP